MSATRQQFKYPSSSSKTTVHTVNVYEDDRISCSCRGFSTPNKCWHVKDAAEVKLGRALVIDTFGAYLGDPLDGCLQPKAEESVVFRSDLFSGIAREERGSTNGFIDPMLASALKEGKSITDYTRHHILEIKYDGHRLIIVVYADGEVLCWKRSGKSYTPPPHLLKLLRQLAPGTYDGEIYVPGGTSTDVPNKLLQTKLVIALFDILKVGDQSCMDLPGRERRQLLEVATSKLNCQEERVHVAPQFGVTQAGLQAIWDRGGEGAVVKDVNATYHPGKRVPEWIKFKKQQAVVVTITGFEAGSLGPHSVIVAVDEHGVEVTCKTLNDEWRDDFRCGRGAAYFVGRKLVISYQEKTRDGRYRHPMADHLLEDE
jgi:ATP-dependent DNA ligase